LVSFGVFGSTLPCNKKAGKPFLLMVSLIVLFPQGIAAQNSSKQIVGAAHSGLGSEMWHGYGLKTGYLGCSAAVCNVLKKAGVKGVSSAAVTIMRSQLLHGPTQCQEFVIKNGEAGRINDAKLLAACRPGDVLVAFAEGPTKPNLGGNAHCGIMGGGTRIYTNDWNDGIWKLVDIHLMFDQYKHVRLLRV